MRIIIYLSFHLSARKDKKIQSCTALFCCTTLSYIQFRAQQKYDSSLCHLISWANFTIMCTRNRKNLTISEILEKFYEKSATDTIASFASLVDIPVSNVQKMLRDGKNIEFAAISGSCTTRKLKGGQHGKVEAVLVD